MKLVNYPLLSNRSDEIVPVEDLQGVVTTERPQEQ